MSSTASEGPFIYSNNSRLIGKPDSREKNAAEKDFGKKSQGLGNRARQLNIRTPLTAWDPFQRKDALMHCPHKVMEVPEAPRNDTNFVFRYHDVRVPCQLEL